VGHIPSACRTNNSSESAFRSLRSAWLTADRERLNSSLAAAIECSSKTGSNTVNKLRSKLRICMVFILVLNKFQDDYESLAAQYDPSSGSRMLDYRRRELDSANFMKDRGKRFVRVAAAMTIRWNSRRVATNSHARDSLTRLQTMGEVDSRCFSHNGIP
jgi:hypothetical protein